MVMIHTYRDTVSHFGTQTSRDAEVIKLVAMSESFSTKLPMYVC